MKNKPGSGPDVRNHSALLCAATGLALALLTLPGAGCVRSDPPPPPTGSTTAAVKAAGTDCVAVSKSWPYKFEPANYWEHEIKVLKDQHDMQACARTCAEMPDCKVATYSDSTIAPDWTNTCVLRNGVGERHPIPSGLCSWVKPANSAPAHP